MLVTPIHVGAPTVASTVNPPTEQVVRDNMVREKILPPNQATESAREKALHKRDKELKGEAWDPSEHPSYASEPAFDELPEDYALHAGYKDEFAVLVKALSVDSYIDSEQELGYSMHIKLPRELLERLERIHDSERTKGVVKYHYAQATVPNPPNRYKVEL